MCITNKVQEIADTFRIKQYMLNMGAGKLARQFGTTKKDIYDAKILARKNLTPGLPKILILDIETAPLKAYVWKRWNQNIGNSDAVLSEWFILTWSAKWLYDNKIMTGVLTSREAKDQNDYRIIKDLWDVIDEADIVIAHNGDRFDIPHINTRFLLHSLPPPSPYQSIDTLQVAKRTFKLSSNRLDDIADRLGLEGKLPTGMKLWVACMEGDKESLKIMSEYNNQDILVLEEVYLKLRPWIKGHPNLGLYMELDNLVCKNCGSDKLIYMNKYHFTNTGKFELYRCECGAVGRRRQSAFDKDKKENLLV